MANIIVYAKETDGHLFPRICMKCGKPAECDVINKFDCLPSWVYVLYYLFFVTGIIPALIATAFARKMKRVTCPMCRRHKYYWTIRKWFIGTGLAVLPLLLFVVTFFLRELDPGTLSILSAVLKYGGGVWLVGALFLIPGRIKADFISEQGIKLVNVHQAFRDAWDRIQPESKATQPDTTHASEVGDFNFK